jgi:hypothetical protein
MSLKLEDRNGSVMIVVGKLESDLELILRRNEAGVTSS